MARREIIQPAREDFEELLALLERAFGHGPGRFQRLLPSVYQCTDEHMRRHYAVRADGRLVAALGVQPMEWQVGDHVLHVAGIGGVGTDPAWRGKGLMSELLEHTRARLREQAYHLSWLGGRRQRYRHFGWEKAGCQLHFELDATNLRHEPSTHVLPRLELCPLPDHDTALASMRQWHDAQPIHCRRRWRGFERVLRDWHAQPCVARDEAGEPVGYLVLDKESKHVVELVGRDETAERALVCAAVEHVEAAPVTILRSPLGDGLNHWLAEIAEHVRLHSMGNWQLFDWPATLEALLALKAASQPLPPGRVVLGLAEAARGLELAVDGGGARVAWTDRPPVLTLDGPALTRLLFGPTSPAQVTTLPAEAAALEAWCPLPATLPYQDKV
ncbi:MAG: GNAT family N-acetyltransferase [Phycisphaeraceae bacterium]